MGDTLCCYEYDGLGQLIREDNAPLNKSFVYTYDKAGNITSRTTYPYSDGELTGIPSTVTYTYSNTSWGDQLTAYKGNSITYDAIGNPTQITTGEASGYNLTWQGRRLLNYTGYGTENGTSLSFTYNDDGIRTSKTVNGVTHTYMLSGSQVIGERWGTNVLLYFYDENGSPMGLAYRNDTYAIGSYTYYYFDKNLQGDIVGIYKDGSVLVGTYTYDAWGNFTVYANSTSELDLLILNTYNPFRYRGYFYDVETELYYLQIRYYNPEWGRFINADTVSVLTATPKSLTDKNLYAYCDNNPMMRKDSNGDFWETAFDIVSLGLSIYDVCNNPDDVMAWVNVAADAIDLIPFVTGVGEVTKTLRVANKIVDAADDLHDAAKVLDNVGDAAGTINDVRKTGWKVGDDITNLTKAGNAPSWSTVRQRYWKNEAALSPSKYKASDIKQMKKGLAPIGADGFPMELHHPFGRSGQNFYVFEPLTKSQHYFTHYGRWP